MVEEKGQGDNKAISSEAVAIFKWEQIGRTIRYAIVVTGVVVGILIITRGVVEVATTPENLWGFLAKLATVIAIPIGAVYWFYLCMWRKVNNYFQNHEERSKKLEQILDPNRESSGMDKIGGSEYDP